MDNEMKEQILTKANHILGITNSHNNLIFMYCPPKVGSTSLVSSLRISLQYNEKEKDKEKYKVFHFHDEQMMAVVTGIEGVTINEIIMFNKTLGKNVYVIDIYRTPLEHAMSLFFEKIALYHFNATEEEMNRSDILRVIHRIFPFLKQKDYFREIFDVDPSLLPSTFNSNTPLFHVVDKGVHYIKLRLMDSEVWGPLLFSIWGKKIILIKDYETEKKVIHLLYKRFQSTYKISANVWDFIYNDKDFCYYLNEDERNMYKERWKDKITSMESKWFSDDEMKIYKEISDENMKENYFQDRNKYTDAGCGCMRCNEKRKEAYHEIQKGKVKKVIHEIEYRTPKPLRKISWFTL